MPQSQGEQLWTVSAAESVTRVLCGGADLIWKEYLSSNSAASTECLLITFDKEPVVVVVQSLSHVQLFATQWTAACRASLFFPISWSSVKLMSSELMMSSNHLIFCTVLVCLHTYTYIYVYVHVCIPTYMHSLLYSRIYRYTYTHTHIYIYTLT